MWQQPVGGPPPGYPAYPPPQQPQAPPGWGAPQPSAQQWGAPQPSAQQWGAPAAYAPAVNHNAPAAHQQPQPHHQAHAQGAASGAVVGPQFVVQQPTTLVLQEQLGRHRQDSFSITDAAGQPWFSLAAAVVSMSNRRTLLDAYNRPLVAMERKLMTMHGTWLLAHPNGARIAEVKPSLASLSPSVKVYLNDGDSSHDFSIKGNFRAKSFEIKDKRSNRVVAKVKKESRFANANALLMSMVTQADRYFLEVQPGTDAAFMAALATLVDEIFNDAKEGPAW